jgi:adenylate kinase family enzyme
VLARELARRLGVPHVELDALFWEPGWRQAEREVFRERVLAALEQDEGWVADGNYLARLGDLVLERADVVVWLDPPLTTIAWRLLRRTRRRIRDGGELWGGNRETWRNVLVGHDALVPYSLRMHYRRRRRWPARLVRFEHVRLRSAREAEEWLRRQG